VSRDRPKSTGPSSPDYSQVDTFLAAILRHQLRKVLRRWLDIHCGSARKGLGGELTGCGHGDG
jgi:hypothetical protein